MITARLPMCFIAWPSPTVVVVLPSPSGVGVIAVTTTYFAFGRSASSSIASRRILARLDPYGSSRCSPMPICDAISGSGLAVAARAISRSDGKDMSSCCRLIFLSCIWSCPSSSPRPAESASVAHRDCSTIRVRSTVRNDEPDSRQASGEYSRRVRTSHRYVAVQRLTQPLVRDNGELRPARWDEALGRAADGFRTTRDTHGGQRDRASSPARSRPTR